jgi:hypothetical protein
VDTHRADDRADRLIADLGLTRLSFPRRRIVYLRRKPSDGGTAIDVTDSPSDNAIAERRQGHWPDIAVD